MVRGRGECSNGSGGVRERFSRAGGDVKRGRGFVEWKAIENGRVQGRARSSRGLCPLVRKRPGELHLVQIKILHIRIWYKQHARTHISL